MDQNFVNLLKDIFGASMIQQFMKECPADWLQMVINFERVKRSTNPDNESLITLPISFEFSECYKSATGRSIKMAISPAHKNKGIMFASGMLRFPYKVMEELFTPIANGIVNHVRKLMWKPQLKQISHFLLVGGFGECLVLQDVLKKEFDSKVKVICPAEASQCVLKGAVLYGHSPSDIAERMARKTYGTDILKTFDPDIHDPNKTVTKDGVKKASPLFKVFVTKGDKIKTGETKSFIFTPASASQTNAGSTIYQTDKKEPMYTDEDGVEKCGEVEIQLPGTGSDREIEYQLTFGGTELEVQARDLRQGGDVARTTVDFLTH